MPGWHRLGIMILWERGGFRVFHAGCRLQVRIRKDAASQRLGAVRLNSEVPNRSKASRRPTRRTTRRTTHDTPNENQYEDRYEDQYEDNRITIMKLENVFSSAFISLFPCSLHSAGAGRGKPRKQLIVPYSLDRKQETGYPKLAGLWTGEENAWRLQTITRQESFQDRSWSMPQPDRSENTTVTSVTECLFVFRPPTGTWQSLFWIGLSGCGSFVKRLCAVSVWGLEEKKKGRGCLLVWFRD